MLLIIHKLEAIKYQIASAFSILRSSLIYDLAAFGYLSIIRYEDSTDREKERAAEREKVKKN